MSSHHGPAKAAPLCINLNDQEAILGPSSGAYASFAILQPVITVELLDKEYHISARFNLQTNIHHEEADDEKDKYDYFFYFYIFFLGDLCLAKD